MDGIQFSPITGQVQMARCCWSAGPDNKKGYLAWRLVVCVVVYGFGKCQRLFLKFLLPVGEICWVKRVADVMV
jgi:hypothetical protein